jgi:cell division septum initiation protein DivIVA
MNPWEYDPLRAEEDIAKLRKANENALAQIEGLKAEVSRLACDKGQLRCDLAAAKRSVEELLAEKKKFLPQELSNGAPNYPLYAAVAECVLRWQRLPWGGEAACAQLLEEILNKHPADAARTPSAAQGGEKT